MTRTYTADPGPSPSFGRKVVTALNELVLAEPLSMICGSFQ